MQFKISCLFIIKVDDTAAISDIGEVAKLKVSARRASKAAKRLQEEVKTIESTLSEAKNKVDWKFKVTYKPIYLINIHSY